MKPGRKPRIGALVMQHAKLHRTVADLVRVTGAAPHTVRAVLRRAADRGEIVLRRFCQGKSGQAIMVVMR